MPGLARLLPYALAFTSSLCIMILELVSSRLVARHVGASLTVWTSVIGIVLGGICLGNVLGGRLADRVEPRRAVGPLFALGAFLTLCSLWINAKIGDLLPSPDQLNWELRTVLVVSLDFLIPATVLGMIGPIVAKMAVEQARRAGSAIGDVYFWGAIGSIVGTLLCGFTLQLYLATSNIVLLVAAGLALLAAALMTGRGGQVVGLLTALLLILGTIQPLVTKLGLGAIDLVRYRPIAAGGVNAMNYLAVAGNGLAILLAVWGLAGLVGSRRREEATEPAAGLDRKKPIEPTPYDDSEAPVGLRDLAALAFIASLVFMALEMVAGRLVTRHLGSSIYGWSSVIAVLLAGLSFGNFLGGKIADFIEDEKQASWLFLLASILTLSILVLETPPKWIMDRFFDKAPAKSVFMWAPSIEQLSLPGGGSIDVTWPYRILIVVTAVFLLPALSMGTVSPVVAKLAVDRQRRFNRTGTAIGQVYAWGMVGSIIGTFLTGFVLIDFLGTKGVILVLGTIMALSATALGGLVHAVWAGIPLGLCVLAFTPPRWVDYLKPVVARADSKLFAKFGENYGIREPLGDPETTPDDLAWIDESDYYYIKIENDQEQGDEGVLNKRTLVLDNLIHGYFILDHPERLDYDYEHIYALVAYRAALAGGKVKFKPTPEPKPLELVPATEPPGEPTRDSAPSKSAAPSGEGATPAKPADSTGDAKAEAAPKEETPPKAEAPPKEGGGLKSIAVSGQDGKKDEAPSGKDAAAPDAKGTPGPSQTPPPAEAPKDGAGASPAQKPEPAPPPAKATGEGADQAKTPAPGGPAGKEIELPSDPFQELKDLDLAKLKQQLDRRTRRESPYIPPVESSELKTLFLGGGAYCFQRHIQYAYPGTAVDVAEIDPAVTRANWMATGLPRNSPINTIWGDARQFVELNQDNKKYDLIFGDAFNDFSVPWHLTTREFNEKLKKMLTPDGVYMINIIDVYLTEANVPDRANEEIKDKEQDAKIKIRKQWLAKVKTGGLTEDEADAKADDEIEAKGKDLVDENTRKAILKKWERRAKEYGGFLGAWTRTARLTFGEDNVYIFGTDTPGKGHRETFVVVASMKPLDLSDLGNRKDDPRYFTVKGNQTTAEAYDKADFDTVVNDRSRGIVLTDDYAPVENLLAPVAETRGDRE